MAISPIDLQTLFTQVDKVGKSQMTLKEAQSIQQAVQGIEIQKKTEEHINQINEAQNTGEGAEKVKDRGQDHGQRQNADGKNEGKEETEEEEQVSVLSDPSLGKNIDISL